MTKNTSIIVIISITIIISLIQNSSASFSINDFGAISNDATNEAALQNSKAISLAILAANGSFTDRTVIIPENEVYYIFAVTISSIYNVSIQMEGSLAISNNITFWSSLSASNSLYFISSHNLTFSGNGVFYGQGYDWWWEVFITGVDHRPNMIYFEQCTNLLIENLTLKNSPQYHMYLHDVKDVIIRNITIIVNVEKQFQIYRHFGVLDEYNIPIFPLNTDGIDPSGTNIIVENCNILNYDDAVAVKPMNGGGVYSNCSSNIIVRNINVTMGVGMTIGSVPPNTNVNCVENVLFDNVHFDHPFKAIYIKTNPGVDGSGIIHNITYQNIEAKGSLWYPIWIGPQQQHQPHESGDGCSFFYPIIKKCGTQPLVPITNIQLINMTMERGLFLPGVILCNSTNPCSNFTFQNITNRGEFIIQRDYVCENVVNYQSISSHPSIECSMTDDASRSRISSSLSSDEILKIIQSYSRNYFDEIENQIIANNKPFRDIPH